MAVLGIDLGTTNSLGAVYRNGKVELIPNRFGSYLTPSVVSVMEDGKIVVGDIAKERLITHPDLTTASFKQDMGTEKRRYLGKEKFLPEELSSFVIRSITEDARAYLGEEIEEVIVSVPAYFHDKQRVATKKAGALAGVTVNRIINEPSAAALASYFDTSEEQLFLVFDFGGGTLDVSVVDCFDTMVEIMAVAGDNHLGGDNFHQLMAEAFLKEYGMKQDSVSAKEYAALLRQAEQCKRKLTEEENAVMTAVIAGETYVSAYSNERLLEECAVIFQRIKKVLAKALKDSELTPKQIDAIVLAGGSSKMPLVQSYLQHLFGQTPVFHANCDELIARGLGLICGVKTREEQVRDYVLTDICPFTLGTGVNNPSNTNMPYMYPLIERNTVLPCSRVKQFFTADDYQEKVKIDIRQGEHTYAKDNLLLGEIELGVPKKPKGEEAVNVRFTYDINGILVVDVEVVSTGKKLKKVISQNMSEAEIARRMLELEKLKVHPKDLSENQLVLERLQTMYEESGPEQRKQIMFYIRHFEYLLEKQKRRPIEKYREFLNIMMEQYEKYDPFAETFLFPEYSDTEEDSEDSQDPEEEDFFEDDWNGGSGGWTS